MVRIELPYHLRTLAKISGEVQLEIEGEATIRKILDALESRCPPLRGTIRDQVTGDRRPFLRFFACQEDRSHDSIDKPLPQPIQSGAEPLIILGAIAGGAGPHNS